MDELTYKTALNVIKDAEKKLNSLGRDLAHENFSEDQDPFAVTFFRGSREKGGIELTFGSERVIAMQIAHFLNTHPRIDRLVALFQLSNACES